MRNACGRGAKWLAHEACASYNHSSQLMQSGSKLKFAGGVAEATLTTAAGVTGGAVCVTGYVASGAVEQGTKFAKHLKAHVAEPSTSTVLPEQNDKFRIQTKAKNMRKICGRGAERLAHEVSVAYNHSSQLMKSGSKAQFAQGVAEATLTTAAGVTGGAVCITGYAASGAIEQGTKLAKCMKRHM